MLHTIKRERTTVICHTNDEIPCAVIWDLQDSWVENPTLHDMRFVLRDMDGSDSFYLGYGDITDLMELLVQVKLTMQKARDNNESE
jgi:hypothetical protein